MKEKAIKEKTEEKEKAKRGWKIYWKLFTSTFYLSAFTFGGGYVIVPLMKKKFVNELHWITEKEMLDFTAIAQSSPGSMAVSASILVGYRMAGFIGVAITVFATLLPPFVLLAVISLFYQAFETSVIVAAALRGMRAGIAAVIADVSISMVGDFIKDKKFVSIGIMVAAFVASYVFNVDIILIILSCAFLGLVGVLYQKLMAKRKKR